MAEEQIQIGAKAEERVQCSNCGKEVVVSQTHSYKGKKGEDIYFCADCKGKIDEQLSAETKNPNFVGALIGGLIGAIIGGSIWYGIAVVTGYEIGYVALGLGYLVGFGVHL